MLSQFCFLLLTVASLSDAVLLPEVEAQSDSTSNHSFVVGKNCFLKDGEQFRYISGSFHYWRQPPEYWKDTFLKMRAAGLNTVQTYINWNLHEPEPLHYNFEGNLDVRKFILLAQQCGLLLILRPGPFIDAEVDMGGLPYWLLRMNSTMQLRTSDPSYLFYVGRWYRKLLPLMKDLTYANGGPIISAQIENEYGWVGHDQVYKEFLRDLLQDILGRDIILFTTDYCLDWAVTAGHLNGTLTTVDFGSNSNVTECFLDVERKFNADGPLVNSEFYPGWLDYWGKPFITLDYKPIVKSMEAMLMMNASFNVYMFFGGTNYGFVAGANVDQDAVSFNPIITSYDYDAPITEAGDPTLKYMKIRELLKKYVPLPPGPVPPDRSKAAYGKIQLSYTGSIFDNLAKLCKNRPIHSELPLSFEVLEQAYGFVLYRTKISNSTRDPALLSVSGLHDRAIVFLDTQPIGTLSRSTGVASLGIYAAAGQMLDLLVQNEGRICSGPINDMKGILGNVSIDGKNLTNWEMFPLDLPGFPQSNPNPFRFERKSIQSEIQTRTPGFYSASFQVDVAQDTFLQLDNWHQGYAFVNGRNIGRYWPVQGPQKTLYVPGVYLIEDGANILELLELEKSPCKHSNRCFVSFVDTPVLNGTVPSFRQPNRDV